MTQNRKEHFHLPEEQKVDFFLGTIRERYGYDFMDYSRSTVNRRLIRFNQKNNISTMEELLDNLLRDSALFEYFVQEFLKD